MVGQKSHAPWPAAAIALALLLAISLGGCGATKQDLSYNKSPSNPVIVYQSLQTIAPAYNPDVPVTVVYGDGSTLKKDGPYLLTTGGAEPGAAAMLASLEEEGFFGLDTEYRGTLTPGGVTEVMTVNLTDGKHQVTVEGGSAPEGWDEIVNTVKDVELTSPGEYVPQAVILFAQVGTAPAGSQNVFPWPGSSDDLVKSAAAGSKGTVLQGDEAGTVWKAIQRGMKDQGDVYWTADGTTYTGVYSSPILPGIKRSG